MCRLRAPRLHNDAICESRHVYWCLSHLADVCSFPGVTRLFLSWGGAPGAGFCCPPLHVLTAAGSAPGAGLRMSSWLWVSLSVSSLMNIIFRLIHLCIAGHDTTPFQGTQDWLMSALESCVCVYGRDWPIIFWLCDALAVLFWFQVLLGS